MQEKKSEPQLRDFSQSIGSQSEKTKSEINVTPKEFINQTSWLKLIYG